jgi:hypothetical protein
MSSGDKDRESTPDPLWHVSKMATVRCARQRVLMMLETSTIGNAVPNSSSTPAVFVS